MQYLIISTEPPAAISMPTTAADLNDAIQYVLDAAWEHDTDQKFDWSLYENARLQAVGIELSRQGESGYVQVTRFDAPDHRPSTNIYQVRYIFELEPNKNGVYLYHHTEITCTNPG